MAICAAVTESRYYYPMHLTTVLLLLAMSAPMSAPSTETDLPSPSCALVIAHRGASALLPEHTLAAYARAIADGADVIEPDLVLTRDGVLIARHENEISGTTDISTHAAFADHRRRKHIDGHEVLGWFTEDLTLAELKTLRARERLPELRGTRHDGQFEIATFAEILSLIQAEHARSGRIIGVAPELKHSSHFRKLGFRPESALLESLSADALARQVPVWVQSFEVAGLRELRGRLGAEFPSIRLVQLLGAPGDRPEDLRAAGDKTRYRDLMTAAGLKEVATYADAIGAPKISIIPLDRSGRFKAASPLVARAHKAGLEVFAYTFRPENQFLPRALWKGEGPRARNESGSVAEIRAYLAAGIDGFFADDPAMARKAGQPK